MTPRQKSKSEKKIVDREIEKEAMDNLLMEKDLKIRDLEMSSTKPAKRVEHLEPELEKMEEKDTREKDRLGKVFAIAEELDNDLKLAVTEMKARDGWYVEHVPLRGPQQGHPRALRDDRASEAERAAQQKADAFVERMDSMVEARAAEMTIEEAEGAIAEEAASRILRRNCRALRGRSRHFGRPRR